MGDGSDPAALPAHHGAEVYCPTCGYDLRGLASNRCPECVETFDIAALADLRLPWVQRRRIGWARAWWRTMWMASVYPEEIGRSLRVGLAVADGRVFAALNVALAGLGWMVLLWALRDQGAGERVMRSLIENSSYRAFTAMLRVLDRGWSLWPARIAVGLGVPITLGLLPVWAARCGMFPKAVRGRIVAGAYYVSGSLIGGAVAGTVVLVGIAGLSLLLHRVVISVGDWLRVVFWAGPYVVPCGVLLVWLNTWRIYRRDAGDLADRAAIPMWLLVVPMLLAVGFVWFVLVPWGIARIYIAIHGLPVW